MDGTCQIFWARKAAWTFEYMALLPKAKEFKELRVKFYNFLIPHPIGGRLGEGG